MKKKISVLVAFLVLFAGYLAQSSESDAGKINLKDVTFNTNLTLALAAAKAQSKPVFVYASSQYCGWCKKFEEETFTNQSVIRTLNQNFVTVAIDVDRQTDESINFRIHGTPSEIFLDPNGIEIKRITGYVDTETFLSTIKDPVFKY